MKSNRVNFLQISDDDRMSLTTAISDEEELESNRASPYKVKSGGSAASFNCTGAVRKAGFLSVKKWLLRKKHQVLTYLMLMSSSGPWIVFELKLDFFLSAAEGQRPSIYSCCCCCSFLLILLADATGKIVFLVPLIP